MEPAWLAVAAFLVVAAALTAHLTRRLARGAAALRQEIDATRRIGAELERLRRALDRLDDDIDRTGSHPAIAPRLVASTVPLPPPDPGP